MRSLSRPSASIQSDERAVFYIVVFSGSRITPIFCFRPVQFAYIAFFLDNAITATGKQPLFCTAYTNLPLKRGNRGEQFFRLVSRAGANRTRPKWLNLGLYAVALMEDSY